MVLVTVIIDRIILIFTAHCPIFYPQTVVSSVLTPVTLSLAVISANRDGSCLAVHNVCKLKCSNIYMTIHLPSNT